MTTATTVPAMTGKEIVDLTKKHTLFEWSAQSKVDPIPVARAKGIYFWTPEGKRFIDFNSQLMSVNIGHGDERGRGWGPSWRRLRRAILTRSFLQTAAQRPTRTPSRSRAFSPGGIRSSRAIGRITVRRPAPSALRAIPGDGPLSRAFRVWSECWIRITASNGDGSRRKLRWP